jgi:hypothetical protein
MVDRCWKQDKCGNSNLQSLNLEWKQDILLEIRQIYKNQIANPKFQSFPFENLVDSKMKIQVAYRIF